MLTLTKKISFYCFLHSILSLILVLTNHTKYYFLFSILHFTIELIRFVIQRYGFYKILFFLILNSFSAVLAYMHDSNDHSIYDDLCSTFYTSDRDMIFSLHIFYFKSVIFAQLFFDLRNHLFRKDLNNTYDTVKYLCLISTVINVFVFPLWSIIECNLDLKIKWLFPTSKSLKNYL